MKKKYFNEYGIDLNYEFRTYKNVGADYGNRKTANRGLISNIMRAFRKNVSNRSEQRYKFCDTYSEWKEHVNYIIPRNMENYDDMLRWLHKEYRTVQIVMENIKIVFIPIYLGIAEIFEGAIIALEGVDISKIVMATTIMTLATIICSIVVLHSSVEKVHFYEDFIKIMENIRK